MQRAVVSISREAEENITRILKDVRHESQASSSGQHRQSSTSWFSHPGPSTSWGSPGACGVGPPGGQEATDSSSLVSASRTHHSAMDVTTQVYMYMYIPVCVYSYTFYTVNTVH